MDYFYLVQSLPEDRLVRVENQTGLIPLIVWAHYILGLAVLVKESPDGDVNFGMTEHPQLIIEWSAPTLSNPSHFHSQRKPRIAAPIIYLLDASLDVILTAEPAENDGLRIEGQECHRLKGYGTTFLQRLFNEKTLVADDDPIYAETANYAVAFAILLSKSMRRLPMIANTRPDTEFEVPMQCYLNTAHWRLFDSGKFLFWGIKLDKRTIIDYSNKMTGASIADMGLPSCIRYHLENAKTNTSEFKGDHFIETIKEPASWILAFAQVTDVESCADLPLRIAPGWMFYGFIASWDGIGAIDVTSSIFFDLVLKLMRKDVTEGVSIVDSEDIFLTSHHGWSLFYGSVGDYDPGRVNCESLSIKRGVPTNTLTLERKYEIADAPHMKPQMRSPTTADKGISYLARCMTKVHKRNEHYSS
jgi:hypothetical protein